MTTNQVSLNSINNNPAYTNPYAKTDQPAATAQVKQDAQKTTQTAKNRHCDHFTTGAPDDQQQ